MDQPAPTIGRIVTYRTLRGLDCAALVIGTPDSEHPTPPADGHLHLHIFYPRDSPPDYITDEGVPQAPGGELAPGTWRWPERV